jgi:hypothetical protein
MEALCTGLEGIGRSEDPGAAPVRISRLEEEFGRVRTVFEEGLSKNWEILSYRSAILSHSVLPDN